MEAIDELDGPWTNLTLDEQLNDLHEGRLGPEYYLGVAKALNAVPLVWFGRNFEDHEDGVWLFEFLGFDLDDVDEIERVPLGEALARLDDLARLCVAGEVEPDEREGLADDIMRALRRLLDVELLFRALMRSSLFGDRRRKARNRVSEWDRARRTAMLEELDDADGLRRVELARILWEDKPDEGKASYEKRIHWLKKEHWGPVKRFEAITVEQLFNGVGYAIGENLDEELTLALSFSDDGDVASDDSMGDALFEAHEDFTDRRSRWATRHDRTESDSKSDDFDFFDDLIVGLDFPASDGGGDSSGESPDGSTDGPSGASPGDPLSACIEACIDQSLFYRLFVRPLALLARSEW